MGKTEDIIQKLDKVMNEIKTVDFKSKRKNFKWITHQVKYDNFQYLCTEYNKKVLSYRRKYEKYVREYKSVYEALKKMENDEFNKEMDSSEVFLTSEIQKELNSFRKIKVKLKKQLDDISKELGQCSRFDLKSKLKVRVAISKATRALNEFKYARKNIKTELKEKSIVTSDTFLHSIFNYKEGKEDKKDKKDKKDKEPDCTGIVGSLYTVQKYLNKYKDNEGWKETDSKSVARMNALLTSSSKSYVKSTWAFSYGIDLVNKFKAKNDGTAKASVGTMKASLNSLKSEMNDFIKDSLDNVLKIKTCIGIESYAYDLKNDFNSKKISWIDKFGKVFEGSPNLETFIDIYFQSRSPLMFKSGQQEDDVMGLMAAWSLSIGITSLLPIALTVLSLSLGAAAVGIILLTVGIAMLSAAILINMNASSYLGKDSLKAVTNAREELSKPQNETSKATKDEKKDEKISQEKDKKVTKDEPEKKKTGGIRKFINHFKKDEKVKEDDKEPKEGGRVHRLVKHFERNKKIIKKGDA